MVTRWKRIVFDFFDDKENRGAVYVMDADGSKMKSLLEDPKADAGGPLWSPDGKRIAYWYWPVDKPQLWVMDANGENRKRLHWWGRPTDWSPGGDKILFISGETMRIKDIISQGDKLVRLVNLASLIEDIEI